MLLQKNQFTTVWSVTFLALGDDTLNNDSEMLKKIVLKVLTNAQNIVRSGLRF